MSRWRSIWLVARREILERGRSRGFILSVLFTTLIVVGSFVLPALLFGGPDVARIGVVQPAPAALGPTVMAIDPGGGPGRRARSRIPDAAAAEAALKAGEVEAVIDVPADLSGPGRVVYKEEADAFLQSLVGAAVVSLRTRRSSRTRTSTRPRSLRRRRRRRRSSSTRRPRPTRRASSFANIGAVLILVGIFSFGFTVLTGVVEEKQSRVVEVVLSTVRARDLLMGKVLGIGILGIVQLAVFVAAAHGRRRRHRPVRAARDDARRDRAARASGSSSATPCTRRPSGSSARSPRAWRRPRTPRPRSR